MGRVGNYLNCPHVLAAGTLANATVFLQLSCSPYWTSARLARQAARNFMKDRGIITGDKRCKRPSDHMDFVRKSPTYFP